MVSLVIGIVILLMVIASLIFSFARTPDNLSGFYGLCYILISIGGIIGGIYLVISGLGLIF